MVPRGARNELATVQLTSAIGETKECPAAGRSQLCVWGWPGNNTTCIWFLPSCNQQPTTTSSDGQARGGGGGQATGRERPVAVQTTKE